MYVLKIFEILYVGEDKKDKKLLYKLEIEMLKNGIFDEGFFEKIKV